MYISLTKFKRSAAKNNFLKSKLFQDSETGRIDKELIGKTRIITVVFNNF